jgi:SPOR domain
MAYFAQAGSGQANSNGGTRNEGANDQYAQPQAAAPQAGAPRAGVQPHLAVRTAFSAQSHSDPRPQSPVSPSPQPRSISPFPVEGPDLHANYRPSVLEGDMDQDVAVSVSFSNPPPAAEPVQKPKLQDYVSEDYAVPGIGAQSFAVSPGEAAFGAQSYGAQSYPDQNFAGQNFADQSYPDQEHEATNSAYQNAAGTASQGLAYGAAQQHSYGYEAEAEPTEDFGYDATGYPASLARSGVARAASLLGAVASLAIVVGIGVWGYNLVMRDVSGVPVVRAVDGPMRAQPANPGGSQADHQGLAVNSVAANGAAEAPADRLTLAPQPIELAEDDRPMARLAIPMDDFQPQVINQGAAQTAQVSEASVAAYRNGDIDALVAELTDGIEPLGQRAPTTAATPLAQAPAIVQPTPLEPIEIAAVSAASAPASALRSAPGVKISLRPNLRPARFSSAVAQPAAGSGRATPEADPNNLPAGTRLAQLGAYESAEVARAEWDRIYARFEDYLEGKTRVIQRAESGGRTFYRLRAMGFTGLSDARRFCSTLVASKADCIPVTTR